MKPRNPVFNNSPHFKDVSSTNSQLREADQPSCYRTPHQPITLDSVVQKSALALFVVLAFAATTWVFTENLFTSGDVATVSAIVGVATLGAFVLSLVNSFKNVVSPALVLTFCAVEGVALGGLSQLFDQRFGSGVVSGAVFGTFAAFVGTLFCYKFFNITVSERFRTFVMSAVFAMIGLSLLELTLSVFDAEIGLFGVSGLAMVTAFAGLVLGVFMLIIDFDFIETAIEARLPDKEAWRAAFALTVSLVWVYVNLLRILAYFSQE